jgi:TPR repeat protein
MPVELSLSDTSSVVMRFLISVMMVAILLSASGAMAGAFEDGVAAYDRMDWATAIRVLRPLAERGDVKAQLLVAHMYSWGQGVPADRKEALRWYRRAAEQGDAVAEAEVGAAYWGIWGPPDIIPRDYSEAAKWYRKAADQGQREAQFALGFMYEDGTVGVPQDYALAHMWLNLAASQGHLVAKIELDKLVSKMTAEQIAEAQRLAREWKPTE